MGKQQNVNMIVLYISVINLFSKKINNNYNKKINKIKIKQLIYVHNVHSLTAKFVWITPIVMNAKDLIIWISKKNCVVLRIIANNVKIMAYHV